MMNERHNGQGTASCPPTKAVLERGNRLSDTEDQLQKLEERLLEAFELFKQAQAEKLALRQDLEEVREESGERAKAIDAHKRELVALRREREEVRIRVEKLLQRIDALTTPQSHG
jgi:chromosome segregation ATPase